jgi:heat shock protein HslJ
MMTCIRPAARRHGIVRCVFAASLLTLACGRSWAADPFPFDQQLMLDAEPMRPAKRVPLLNVAANGEATIDLWCKTVSARVQVSGDAIKIEPGPLPDALPAMMGEGQCAPPRVSADQDLLDGLSQATAWKMQDGSLVLVGPKPMKFSPATN